jgi:hypothetical protein
MRTMLLLLVMAALAAPVVALADTAPTPASAANQLCQQSKTTLGANFASTYGTNANKSNAFGKCVSQNAKNAQNAVENASKACTAEQTADPAAFAKKYGSNGKPGSEGAAKNAFGKCVSNSTHASVVAAAAAAPSAAKSCKADRKADPAAFATKYGKGANAFGKCVAAHAKTK